MASNASKIWDFLRSNGLNEYGAAGLMGNLYYESSLDPENLQNSYERSLGYTDKSYTKAVDNGTYTKKQFTYDSAGYGLAQWTYSSRKKKLYEYVKSKKKSIGDLTAQLEFLLSELKNSYTSVFSVLKTAKSVRKASDKVLKGFEKPADQSSSVQSKRAAKGIEYYNTYSGRKAVSTTDDREYSTVTVELEDLVDLQNLYQYIITIDRNTGKNLNLSKIKKSLNLVGALVEGGYLFKPDGTKVSTFTNPKISTQIKELASNKLPWGIYVVSNAKSKSDALLELDELYYVLSEWTPELGVWVVPNWTNNLSVNDGILNTYYKQLVKFGFFGKMGLMATKTQVSKLNWEKHHNSWFLWWVNHTAVSEYKDEVITPEFFMLNDGKNNPQPVTIQRATN